MKILLVDDHADMRRMLRNILTPASGQDHEFFECADGDEVVALFSAHHPDFVIMDVQLKSTDGFKTTEKICQFDPAAKVIFVIAYPTPAVRQKAERLTAWAFVSKDNLLALSSMLLS